jgi:hypothetical protein
MSANESTAAELARRHLDHAYGTTERGQAYASLALAEAVVTASQTLASAIIEAARILAPSFVVHGKDPK